MATKLALAIYAFTFFHSANAAAPQTPIVPYVTVFQLCANVPKGQYCNSAFPRSFISCPNGITKYCPPHQVCQNGDVLGEVKCVPNLWDPIVQLCAGKPSSTSWCYKNMTVECPNGEQFLCPPDMACKRRGRRAYCVQPQFLPSEPDGADQLCAGLDKNQNATVCHPVNLKKVISCPSGAVFRCGLGEICDAPTNAASAKCVKIQDTLTRFCSNKPLFSSRCLPGTNGSVVMCGQQPYIVSCPTGKCVQELGITARCI